VRLACEGEGFQGGGQAGVWSLYPVSSTCGQVRRDSITTKSTSKDKSNQRELVESFKLDDDRVKERKKEKN